MKGTEDANEVEDRRCRQRTGPVLQHDQHVDGAGLGTCANRYRDLQSPTAAFSWTIAESIPFKDLQYSFDPQTTTGAITVTDDRGTKAGWALYVSGTDFVGASTKDVIPIGNLALAEGSVQVLQGQTSPMPTTSSLAAVTGSPQLVMSAATGAGAGRYSVQFTGTLQVPAGQRVDTYSSTLTVNQTTAP